MRPAVLTFAPTGFDTARRIARILHGRELTPEQSREQLPRLFRSGTPIIGVCAAGILIRLLAPLLEDKHEEPPVLAVSQDGAYVVPLLGGHHGANRMARELAEALRGEAALTTASDSLFGFGLDDPPKGWKLVYDDDIKRSMSNVLQGAKLAVEGDGRWLQAAGYELGNGGAVQIVASPSIEHFAPIIYRPQTLVVGVGCERGTSADELVDLIKASLAEARLGWQSIAAIASVDLKADERAIHEAAARFDTVARFFTVAELDAMRDRLATPSQVVEAEIGTPGVAEAAALLAGELVLPKRKSARATCAIGMAPNPIDPDTFGRRQGTLHIVGIGPGDAASRTGSAVAALEASSDWVGYELYLDLIADLRDDQQKHAFPLGDEEPRVRHALELAATGRTVALVCSGDAQIYAMAALAYELLDATGARAVTEAARRVAVACHPGVSAFQAASAAAGALIGHDFCCISLSDLLTPREAIRQRLRGAAEGDFVTAFYNPRSGRRLDLLGEAKDLFARHRPPETPVIVARNLGRAEQTVLVTTLAAFDPTTVDMLTIVLIGSSTSRAFKRGDGRTVAYTPRGYEAKGAAK